MNLDLNLIELNVNLKTNYPHKYVCHTHYTAMQLRVFSKEDTTCDICIFIFMIISVLTNLDDGPKNKRRDKEMERDRSGWRVQVSQMNVEVSQMNGCLMLKCDTITLCYKRLVSVELYHRLVSVELYHR